MEWRTVAFIVLVVSLCFLAIPIKVDPDTSNEDIKLFQNYVARYNKSYRTDPSEYEERFKRFQDYNIHLDKSYRIILIILNVRRIDNQL
ncbi:hypothetical protein E2986_12877 [Frieseomelitta varia]|uniref:Cathepsin propeptide inhibitor domain-containing protein n=1 Tax=Frieseomelitta varia TaxID=561572 RepID=A0A833WF19_9HYME|nr:hypothetical protein E2986_12877 [Frieseomelitta varia]